MKLSIWNIYQRLPYPNKIPLVKDGSPTIQSVRWIVSKDLNPSTVYVGKEEEFFAGIGGSTLLVHRNDMILVQNADPEEVFNEISSILERYQAWDAALEACADKPNGLTELLAVSADIFQNPAFVYGPDGKALAIAPGFPASLHWHWAEILEHRGLTRERMVYLQKAIGLAEIFLERKPVIHDFCPGEPQYLHCSLVVNGYMAGHLVIFGMCHPFARGVEHLASHLVSHMLRYMTRHYEAYSPTSRVGALLTALIHQRPCEPEELLLFQQLLGWDSDADTFQFYLLKEKVRGAPVLLPHVCQRLSAALPGSVVFQENTLLLVLLNRTRTPSAASDLERQLDTLDKNFYCGISAPFQGTGPIAWYYKQALAELIRCKERRLSRSRGVDHIGDHLLELLRRDPLNQTYLVPELLTLRACDRREQTHYYETLRAWFYSGFHPTSAAALLHLHRNSFNYRMERIRERIPFDAIDALAANPDRMRLNEYLYTFLYLDAVDSLP